MRMDIRQSPAYGEGLFDAAGKTCALCSEFFHWSEQVSPILGRF
jgi:hypothetical protein